MQRQVTYELNANAVEESSKDLHLKKPISLSEGNQHTVVFPLTTNPN